MGLGRWLRHALTLPGAIGRALPLPAQDRIEQTIAVSEATHRGEIRLAVEASLPWSYLKRNAPVRERAEMLFAKLRVWDTEERNGVLIYVDLADHAIEIVADRGLARVVPPEAWPPIVAGITDKLRDGDFEAGIMAGIDEVGRLLAKHFPPREGGRDENELPNRPVIVGR